MGKVTHQNKFCTPEASVGSSASTHSKGIRGNLQKVSKSTPRHAPKRQSTIQYIRETAAAIVASSQSGKSRSRPNLPPMSSTPLKTASTKTKDTLKEQQTINQQRRSRSHSLAKPGKSSKEDILEATFVVEEHPVDNNKSKHHSTSEGAAQLTRSGTFTVRRSHKKEDSNAGNSVQLTKTTRDSTGSACGGGNTESKLSLHPCRSQSGHSLDKLVDPIMDCITTLEKQHQDCLNAVLRSCAISTLTSRKIRQSPGESQDIELDQMIQELSSLYEVKIDKLLQVKRQRIREFMLAQVRKRRG